jgi:hypothetical protein
MTPLNRLLLISLLISFFSAACSQPPPESASPPVAQKITSESVVKVVAQPVEIQAGGSADANVRLTIQNGYHVNANPPTFPYLKATVLEIPTADGVSVGFITYPKGVEKKFVFAEKALTVYEGETDLKATLKTNQTATKGAHSIPARLRIQACDEQVCYPPGTLELTIPVKVN